MRRQCGCELGRDCTKTTLCQANEIADDLYLMTEERDVYRRACWEALQCLTDDDYSPYQKAKRALRSLSDALENWGYPDE